MNWHVFGTTVQQRQTLRPCQIGIMLSVRVRVGFRVLSPIKKTNLLVKFSYIFPMFWNSEKNNNN